MHRGDSTHVMVLGVARPPTPTRPPVFAVQRLVDTQSPSASRGPIPHPLPGPAPMAATRGEMSLTAISGPSRPTRRVRSVLGSIEAARPEFSTARTPGSLLQLGHSAAPNGKLAAGYQAGSRVGRSDIFRTPE